MPYFIETTASIRSTGYFGAFVWTHALVISPPRNQGDFLLFFSQLFYLFDMPRLMAAYQCQPFSR